MTLAAELEKVFGDEPFDSTDVSHRATQHPALWTALRVEIPKALPKGANWFKTSAVRALLRRTPGVCAHHDARFDYWFFRILKEEE